MIRILKILIIYLVLSVSYVVYAVNLPGMSDDDDETLQTYLEKVQSSEVENSRDYEGIRPASLNKRPWTSDSLNDMELLEWPDPEPHVDQDEGDNFRYYVSECMFSSGYPHVLGPVTSASDNGCYETYYFYPLFWLRPGSIITGAKVEGPAKLAGYSAYGREKIDIFYKESPTVGGMPTWTLWIYDNATYGTEIILTVYTVSDTNYQDRAYLNEINAALGTKVTEADLRKSKDNTISYYVNKGCEAKTLIHCEEVCQCTGITPLIYDDDADDAIGSAGSVNLWVDSGGLACPPYTWTVSGDGWSIKDTDEADAVTDNDLETATLTLINTSGKTCGVDYSVYATVTVTDDCGVTDDIVMRYSGGTWTQVEIWKGNCDHNCGNDLCAIISQNVIYTSGQYQWRANWNLMGCFNNDGYSCTYTGWHYEKRTAGSSTCLGDLTYPQPPVSPQNYYLGIGGTGGGTDCSMYGGCLAVYDVAYIIPQVGYTYLWSCP